MILLFCHERLLADRAVGRAYMLQCCVRLSVVCNVGIHCGWTVHLTENCIKKQIGNGLYGESNGHVTDDVTWPWKVKVTNPIRLGPNISKTAGDAI